MKSTEMEVAPTHETEGVEPKKTSPNTSDNPQNTEVFGGGEAAPMLEIEHYRKKGSRARKRKYENTGIHGDPPVKDLILFRHKMRRHVSGLSDDMEHWYEFWYFTRPNRAKDGDKYERHVKAYARGRRWIAEDEGIETVGSSGKVLPYRKRASS